MLFRSQLPLTLLPFNKTEEFLANVGNFSYKAAIRDLDKEPLTEKEYSTLKTLYEQSGEIQQDLRKVQYMVLENNLRWMDVELALATEKGQTDNTIIDGFKTVEKTVEGYSETDFGPAQINLQLKDENFKKLPGDKISKEDAVQITRKYTPIKGGEVKVTTNGKGSDYGFFSVSIQNPETNLEASMDITKKGGYPIWFLLDRDVKNQKLSLNDASNKAITFLKDHNFENLDLFESAQYDNIGVFTFVGTQDGIRVYPDAINMKVALDNGDVIGFSAEDYLKSHKARKIPQAGIEIEEAKKKVNPNLKVMDEKKAIILNDLNEEVLCYEFTGVLGNDTFRIYINAEDGTEEKVEKLQNAEPVYEDVV